MNELIHKNFSFEQIDYEFYGLSNEHIFIQIPWYEYELLIYIKNLNLNGVYIDVGGNIGNHSLFFLNHCRSTKLYVFEPEDFCYKILVKNLIKNTKKEYVLNNLAIWNRKVDLKLIRFESFNNTGMSKVFEVNENDNEELLIKANSLDNIISFNENIVLIKIDAEGSEQKVLEGAINLIKLNMPIIICEAATEPEFNEINKMLIPLGYKIPIRVFNATPTYVWNK
jgi:FkbM family methyltransferase